MGARHIPAGARHEPSAAGFAPFTASKMLKLFRPRVLVAAAMRNLQQQQQQLPPLPPLAPLAPLAPTRSFSAGAEPLSEAEVLDCQAKWASAIKTISQTYLDKGDYIGVAGEVRVPKSNGARGVGW